ncbi:glycosyltransferase putative [Leptolyngbya sp. Heron Island J]|uniref:glycosyltransferase family 61 protein n=1 Tax=Leptolyngbya sp. Heron Island J TaxID=1385935 RepID=UPI0003B9840F|nr:glycosyltransferase family 61 protein [Leptolyngbya sp. Heron Island J]ESA37263.1 glycosyltransferase putative [Leptolyngbya sp. Heron Island J]
MKTLITRLRIILSKIKTLSFKASILMLSLFWRKALNRDQSIDALKEDVVYKKENKHINIADISSNNGSKILNLDDFKEPHMLNTSNIYFEPSYVWKITEDSTIKNLSLTSSGIAILNQKLLLDLDYGNISGYKELPWKFNTIEYPLVIAPWSHPTSFSYFGFVGLILSKLCRIEHALSKNIWKDAKLCYPLYNTQYERDYLSYLDIPTSSIIDTRNKNIQIKAKSLILANNQSRINRISPQDISLLRQRFLPQISIKRSGRRLFLPRRGKRVIKNELEVRNLLENVFEFETVEDEHRSIEEQIALYQGASVIVAPHGAGLTNLIWCHPGTQVVELFYGGYRKAGFYYLSQVLDLNYSCVIDDDFSVESFVNQYHDMQVDLRILRNTLDKIFNH